MRRISDHRLLTPLLVTGLATCAAVAYVLYAPPKAVEGWTQGPPAEETLAIVGAYMRLLDRRPTTTELAEVKARLAADPTFSLGVLENKLAVSQEHRRRVATQTNALRTDLEGVYTRQQVRLHIRSVYTDEIGAAPSREAEAFLMERYVSSGMNEHELIRLVKAIAIVPIAGNPTPLGSGRTL